MFDKLEEERRIREESHSKFGRMLDEMQGKVR
jgi:hypothetical protein